MKGKHNAPYAKSPDPDSAANHEVVEECEAKADVTAVNKHQISRQAPNLILSTMDNKISIWADKQRELKGSMVWVIVWLRLCLYHMTKATAKNATSRTPT